MEVGGSPPERYRRTWSWSSACTATTGVIGAHTDPVLDPICWTEVPSSMRIRGTSATAAPRAVGDAVETPADAVQSPLRSPRVRGGSLLRLLRGSGTGGGGRRVRAPGDQLLPRRAVRAVRRVVPGLGSLRRAAVPDGRRHRDPAPVPVPAHQGPVILVAAALLEFFASADPHLRALQGDVPGAGSCRQERWRGSPKARRRTAFARPIRRSRRVTEPSGNRPSNRSIRTFDRPRQARQSVPHRPMSAGSGFAILSSPPDRGAPVHAPSEAIPPSHVERCRGRRSAAGSATPSVAAVSIGLGRLCQVVGVGSAFRGTAATSTEPNTGQAYRRAVADAAAGRASALALMVTGGTINVYFHVINKGTGWRTATSHSLRSTPR